MPERSGTISGYPVISRGGKEYRVHRYRAERALGRSIPHGVEIHHVDGDKHNPNARLVICQNRAYHELLHVRQRVQEHGGNPDTDKICSSCKNLRNKCDFNVNNATGDRLSAYCRSCQSVKHREAYVRGKKTAP